MRLELDLPEAALSSDEWYTPPAIFDRLGLTFDLDVCAPPGGVPWIPAERSYDWHADGLTAPWYGRVWCNPPYGSPRRWLDRFTQHADGLALVPADLANRGIYPAADAGDALCFLRDRVVFVRPGSDNVTSARFPSLLIAHGLASVEALRRSGLGLVVLLSTPDEAE